MQGCMVIRAYETEEKPLAYAEDLFTPQPAEKTPGESVAQPAKETPGESAPKPAREAMQ